MSDALIDLRSAAGLLALQSLPGIGPRSALRAATARSLSALADPPSYSTFMKAYEAALERIHENEQAGVRELGFYAPSYPQRLRALADAPPVLYYRGDIKVLSSPLVAVVGTRQPSLFGRSATDALTRVIANAGYGICSGLALGVDGISHRAALEEGVPTVAVLGCGLDNVTPPEHRGLARDIIQCGGLLLSEQCLRTSPSARTLVSRNRIQSGLSVGVLIAQTPVKSGTMHTARYAAAQGRPVFCPLPPEGTVLAPASAGSTILLERPASELADLLPAFRGSRRLCRELGEKPLARAVTRTNIEEMLAAFAMEARA